MTAFAKDSKIKIELKRYRYAQNKKHDESKGAE